MTVFAFLDVKQETICIVEQIVVAEKSRRKYPRAVMT